MGREDVDRSVDPFPLALDRRIEDQRLRQFLVRSIGHGCQRDHGSVEHDGDRGFRLHVDRPWGRYDLRHREVAHSAEVETVVVLQ